MWEHADVGPRERTVWGPGRGTGWEGTETQTTEIVPQAAEASLSEIMGMSLNFIPQKGKVVWLFKQGVDMIISC